MKVSMMNLNAIVRNLSVLAFNIFAMAEVRFFAYFYFYFFGFFTFTKNRKHACVTA